MRTALLLILLAQPTFAATFTAPQGCTANLTVQSRGCTVSHESIVQASTRRVHEFERLIARPSTR